MPLHVGAARDPRLTNSAGTWYPNSVTEKGGGDGDGWRGTERNRNTHGGDPGSFIAEPFDAVKLVQAVLLVFRGIVLGLLALLPSMVQACVCGGVTSTCDTGWNLGDTFFLGKTIAMDKVMKPQSDVFLSSFAARFTVEEGFRGAVVGEVVVYTGAGGGDCGYPFVPGASYLVYATRSATDGLLHAGICSETKPAVTAGGVLRELRALQDHTRSDDVFGTIGMAPRGARFDDLVESQPLDRVPCVPPPVAGFRSPRRPTPVASTHSRPYRVGPTRSSRTCLRVSAGEPRR